MSVLALIAGWIARWFAIDAMKVVMWRLFFWTLSTLVLSTVIYYAVSHVVMDIVSFAQDRLSQATGGSSLTAVRLVGCAGWLATMLKLPEAFSVILSAIMLRWSISLIPFIGGKL